MAAYQLRFRVGYNSLLTALAITCCVLAQLRVASTCSVAPGPKILIGSFNIRQLGQSKMSKADVMEIIYTIMSRYDMLLIQEVTDVSMQTLPAMLMQLNSRQVWNPFKYVESARLGRSDSKEQYALWYRSGITVSSIYQYSDPNDVFEREPFLTVVHIPNGKTVKTVGLINVHIRPDDAANEISALPTVYDYYRELLGLEDIMIAGDFNADCEYVSASKLAKLTLRTDPRFAWLISDDADTTVGTSNCAYDRFVVAGSAFLSGLDNCTASVFNFDTEYNLDAEFAKSVSDHYPIDIQFFTNRWEN